MNCEAIQKLLSWKCEPAGERAFKLTSPINLGEDGELLSLYLAYPDDRTIYMTDAGQCLIHARAHGIKISKQRMEYLNRTEGTQFARFATSGEIEVQTSIDNAESALWDVVKLALNSAFHYPKWRPKFHEVKFEQTVREYLAAEFGKDSLTRNYEVAGLSGKIIEFPMLLKTNGKDYLIQTLAADNDNYDWTRIYSIHGKFSDIKRTSLSAKRLTIIEKSSSKQLGTIKTFLSEVTEATLLENAVNAIAA